MATQQQNELGIFLAPLVDLACNMILAGVLNKNVVKHFTNKGLAFNAAENIVEVAAFRANESLKNKSK